MKNKQKINLNKIRKIVSDYLRMTCITLSGLVLLITIIFLYHNCYRANIEVKVLKVLKRQVALNVVDIELWDEINRNIEWKKQEVQEGLLGRNPFE